MPLIPIHDANPRFYIRAHFVTIALIVLNLVIFVSMMNMSEADLFDTLLGFSLIPARLIEGVELPPGMSGISPLMTLVSYQFLHGGWAHILFNMLFLWIFGDNIEDALGHRNFAIFFLLCGMAGGLLHSLIDGSSVTPVIGASGSIAGVLGAYLLLYPRARLLVLAFVIIPVRLPAILVIGTFFAQDLIWAATSAAGTLDVAVWAHIGGFVTGMVLVLFLRNPRVALWHRPPDPWG